MGKLPKVAVIVVNWNGLVDTIECLESVRRLDYPDVDAIVVDNGSSDGSPGAVRANFPDVSLIETGTNLGFAEGNNVGIEVGLQRGADYIFLLNNDAVIRPNALSILVARAESRPDVAFLSPKIVYHHDNSQIWAAGLEINCVGGGQLLRELAGRRKGVYTTLLVGNRGHNETDRGQFDVQAEIDGATGCALLARSSVARRIGLLDVDYFLLFEDADWSMRARRAGHKILYVPEAVVLHKASRSLKGSRSRPTLYYSTRNTLLFARRNGSAILRAWLYLVGCGVLLKSGAKWLLNRDEGAKVRARAVVDFWLGRFGARV